MLEGMADRRDVDFTYSVTDRIIRLSLGELPDFSGAMFDGDFSLGLEQAQRRKHDYVAEQVGIGAGAAPARPGLRLGSVAGLCPGARWGRGGGDALLGATGGLPPARA